MPRSRDLREPTGSAVASGEFQERSSARRVVVSPRLGYQTRLKLRYGTDLRVYRQPQGGPVDLPAHHRIDQRGHDTQHPMPLTARKQSAAVETRERKHRNVPLLLS